MALPSSGLEDLVDNEDYYSLLNAPRNATQDDLKGSYRKLCMVYHPDKHDRADNKEASEIFGKIQTAYTVLSDPAKRHIYDNYGKQGLDSDWQLIERRKTPQERQEEYERIQRLRAQHKLEERTNPSGNLSITVNATSLFDDQLLSNDDIAYQQITLPDITKMSMSQSIEAPLSMSHTATLSGNLQSTNGNGSGSFNVAMRKTLTGKSWAEFMFGATDSRAFSLGMKGYYSFGGGVFAIAQFPVGVMIDDDMLAVTLPGPHLQLGRVMAESMYGSLDLSVGDAPHLAANLVKDSTAFRALAKLQLGFPHSFGVLSLTYKRPDQKANLKCAIKAGTFGCMVEYGAEHQVSQHSTVSAHLNIGVPLGVSVKLKLTRASQTYTMPIILSDDVNVVAAFYGTVFPLAVYAAVHVLVVRPYLRRKREREEYENEQSLQEETLQNRREAEYIVRMMRGATERKLQVEERKMGLVIVEALYGRLVMNESFQPARVVDVRIALQNLVDNSQVRLPPNITKSGLPGFYDPCPGGQKQLKVTYKFRGGLHQILIADHDALRIPLKSHSIEKRDSVG